MPSKAFNDFRNYLLKDVDGLIDAHGKLSTGPGRKGLGHITRSAIVLLCAAWEYYIELLASNIIEYYCTKKKVNTLPMINADNFLKFLQAEKNKGILKDAVEGNWSDALHAYLDPRIKRLNTPNLNNIDDIFCGLGINLANVIQGQDIHNLLSSLITTRGDIAHKGARTIYPKIGEVKEYRNFIKNLIQYIDEELSQHLKDRHGKAPWQKISGSVRIPDI